MTNRTIIGKAFFTVLVIATCVVTSIFTCSFVTRTKAEKALIKTNESVNITVLEHELRSASDLVTQKYEYTDKFTDEQSKRLLIDLPFTRKRTEFTYRGAVSVGYDLSQVKPELDGAGKRIVITLPEQKVIASEIYPESYEYIVQDDSIFNRYKPEDMTEFQSRIKEKMQKTAEEDDELASKSRANAEAILSDLLESTGLIGGYEVVFI